MTVASIAPAGQETRTIFRAATFGDVLRSEWTKLRSVRSTVRDQKVDRTERSFSHSIRATVRKP